MAKSANLYVRVDPDIKAAAESLYSSFGITVSDAINMFLTKSLMVGGLPFDLRQPTPNETTLAAMQEVQDMIDGKIIAEPKSAKELFEELGI